MYGSHRLHQSLCSKLKTLVISAKKILFIPSVMKQKWLWVNIPNSLTKVFKFILYILIPHIIWYSYLYLEVYIKSGIIGMAVTCLTVCNVLTAIHVRQNWGGGKLTTGCFTDPWQFILSGTRRKHTKFLQMPPKQTAHGMEEAVQCGQCRTHCN